MHNIDAIDIETHVNQVSLYRNIIKRKDLRKSDSLEYSYKTSWPTVFDGEGSARKLYIRLVSGEQKRS